MYTENEIASQSKVGNQRTGCTDSDTHSNYTKIACKIPVSSTDNLESSKTSKSDKNVAKMPS